MKSRQEELLDTARKLFFARGYRGTTMQQIAEHAGYSKRTVYLDYPSKDELFITVCAEGVQVILDRLQEIPVDELNSEAYLEKVMQTYVWFSGTYREYFRMLFSEATPELIMNCSPELQERVAYLEHACLSVLVAWADRAMKEGHIKPEDPWEVAGILLGSATGIILLSMMGGTQTFFSEETLEDMVQKAARTLFRGACMSGAWTGAAGREPDAGKDSSGNPGPHS